MEEIHDIVTSTSLTNEQKVSAIEKYVIKARIEELEKELLRQELYLQKLCWEVRYIASFTQGLRKRISELKAKIK